MTGRNTAQDVEMQFQEILLVIEHPAAEPQIEPGDVLDRAVGDQVGVELRPDFSVSPGRTMTA